MKCSQCGKEIVDPYCEQVCPKHLCQECGEKCSDALSDDEGKWPSETCEECPYQRDDDYDDYSSEPPTDEENEEMIDEEQAERDAEAEDVYY